MGHVSIDKSYARAGRSKMAPLLETEALSYPFEKISMDMSGLYCCKTSGNLSIGRFCGLVETFARGDKTAQTRFGASLEIVTDNGSINVIEVMAHTSKREGG